MSGFATPTGSPSDLRLFCDSLPYGDSQSLPPLQVERLLKNRFLRELVLALGCEPYAPSEGLKAAIALDAAHPALVFGELELRPTFVVMFQSLLDFHVVVPSGYLWRQVHPALATAIERMSFLVCPTCQAHLLEQETECWMCEANRPIFHVMKAFRDVQRLRAPIVLVGAAVVPKDVLPAKVVPESVIRMTVPAGSLLVTKMDGNGALVRYYRIFATNGETGYLRVIRSGIRDIVSCVSAADILTEFPTVPPGFLSWWEFLSLEG